MKVPMSWLQEWVDVPWSAAELGSRLTMAGFELEGVEPAAPAFSGVVAYYSVHNLPRPALRTAFAEIHRILKPSSSFVVATHLGEGEVYSTKFLGHDIETVGGILYRDDELLALLDSHSFLVEEVRYRDPLPHEHNTQRIYLSRRRVDT